MTILREKILKYDLKKSKFCREKAPLQDAKKIFRIDFKMREEMYF